MEAAFSVTIFFLALFAMLYLFQFLLGINQVQVQTANAVQQYACYGTKLGTVQGLLDQGVLLQWDEEQDICYTSYSRSVPFLSESFFKVRFYQQMKINDYAGRSMVSENTDEEYVYLTENGTVYHLDKGCVYLNPGITSMRYAKAQTQRNRSGGKYYPCEKCCTDTLSDSTVIYLTPYGDRVHTDKNCSGLKRTVRRVRRFEVGDMKGCSKCAGEGG